MDVIRRNTDYALRLMVGVACAGVGVDEAQAGGADVDGVGSGGMVSAKTLSVEQEVPYQLTCKLLQKLHGAGFLESRMGSKGGFALAKRPGEISLADVINVIQGPLVLNRCMLGKDQCSKQCDCPISKKLTGLQSYIEGFLTDVTLEDLLKSLNS